MSRKVEDVLRDATLHGKAVCIAAYDLAPAGSKDKGRAASVVQALRVKYGRDATSLGLTFAVGRVEVDGTEKSGVWVKCDPTLVEQGAYERHKAIERQKVAEANAKKKAKDAEKRAAA